MTVGELKKMLEKFPDDMGILNIRYSDYDHVEEYEWGVVKGVDNDGYVMRSHGTMSTKNKEKEKEYLCLGGI